VPDSQHENSVGAKADERHSLPSVVRIVLAAAAVVVALFALPWVALLRGEMREPVRKFREVDAKPVFAKVERVFGLAFPKQCSDMRAALRDPYEAILRFRTTKPGLKRFAESFSGDAIRPQPIPRANTLKRNAFFEGELHGYLGWWDVDKLQDTLEGRVFVIDGTTMHSLCCVVEMKDPTEPIVYIYVEHNWERHSNLGVPEE